MTEKAICSASKLINKLKGCNSKHQFKILIVDDDLDTAEAFGEILRSRGHNVIVINEGISCVSKCQNFNFDIIFMDFHMSDISGVDATDLIKNCCYTKSLIFAFTGDDSRTALLKFKNIGMDGAIIKPLDIEIINKLMNSLELRNELDKRVLKNIRDLKNKKQLFVFNQEMF